MGTTGAMGMADEVNQGNVDLRSALYWMLTANHYPPLPSCLVEIAEWAIDEANDGHWDAEHQMPGGLQFRYRDTITVGEAIESMHLDCFLEDQED